jgi:integrase
VGQLLRTWLAAIKPTVAGTTHVVYERDCKNALLPHLGGVKLAKLTALHVQKLYGDLATAGVSSCMQRKAGVTLGVALQHAIRLKLIPHNVARDVKKPRHVPEEMQVLDPAQVQLFLRVAAEDRLYALYAFLIDSGAREGEAFGLQWNDFDWAGNAVQIVRTLQEVKGIQTLKELKTKKSRRRVVLSSFTMTVLADHRKRMLAEGNYKGNGPIFCDTIGGRLRYSNLLRRSFRPLIALANKKASEEADKKGTEPVRIPDIRPYDLRHSSATLLLLAGEDSKVVAERLGHSTTRLTQDTYQHVLPGMQERAAAKLDAILRSSQPAKASC